MFDDNFTEISRKGMTCSKSYSFSEVMITDIDVGCSGGKCVSGFNITSSGTNKSFGLTYDGDLSKIKNYAKVDVSIKNCSFATSVSENWNLSIFFWAFGGFIITLILAAAGKSR